MAIREHPSLAPIPFLLSMGFSLIARPMSLTGSLQTFIMSTISPLKFLKAGCVKILLQHMKVELTRAGC
jgi:hypothetical protein